MIVWLSFDSHASDGQVWSIRAGRTWHRAADVRIHIPMQTVYKGPQAKQPKAYLKGQGTCAIRQGVAVLQA